MSEASLYNYEKLANFITSLVDDGIYLKGSKVPSLREISNHHNVSLSTATQAYHLLEDKGILEAKPKSGFFVAHRPTPLNTPKITKSSSVPVDVTNSGIFLELLEHSSNPKFAPFGCAIPSAKVLGASKLDRALARAARVQGVNNNIYTVPKGDLGLRQQIARRALQWGQIISTDDIIITCGCTEALSVSLRSLTNAGDTVAVESPAYFGHLQLLKALKLKVLEISNDSQNGLDLVSLEAAFENKSVKACLFSSSFSNPVGNTISNNQKHETLDLLDKFNIPLIEDDLMGDIYFTQDRPKPFMAIDSAKYKNIIYCSSFSKTIAPGYRIGWAVTNQHMDDVLENKIATSLASPTLTQVAMADFLSQSGYENHLRRIRRIFANNLDRLTRAIEKHFPEGTRVSRPDGGFLLWLELPFKIDGIELFNNALAQDICFAPGSVFSANPKHQKFANCLRLSAGHEWSDQIEIALKKLGEMAIQSRIN